MLHRDACDPTQASSTPTGKMVSRIRLSLGREYRCCLRSWFDIPSLTRIFSLPCRANNLPAEQERGHPSCMLASLHREFDHDKLQVRYVLQTQKKRYQFGMPDSAVAHELTGSHDRAYQNVEPTRGGDKHRDGCAVCALRMGTDRVFWAVLCACAVWRMYLFLGNSLDIFVSLSFECPCSLWCIDCVKSALKPVCTRHSIKERGESIRDTPASEWAERARCGCAIF